MISTLAYIMVIDKRRKYVYLYKKQGIKALHLYLLENALLKNSLRVQAYGTVDEVSSALGLARAFAKKEEVKQLLLELEQTNLKLMADLASITDKYYINNEIISNIDQKSLSLKLNYQH